MKPSIFFSVSGVGSYCTTVVLIVAGSMLLALSRPSKIDWLVPAWMPMVLPARSAIVRIGLPSSSDRMQNGFFWNVAPMIFSGAPCSAISRAVASGAERPTSTGAGHDERVRAVHRAGDQVEALEARVLVVALRVGEELAGELDVLDPGQLERELAVGARGHRARPGRGCAAAGRAGSGAAVPPHAASAPRLRAPRPLEARKLRRVDFEVNQDTDPPGQDVDESGCATDGRGHTVSGRLGDVVSDS